MRKDNKFIAWTSILFTCSFVLVTILFERTGIAFISSLNGFFIIGCTAFLIACTIIKKISNKNQLRNCFVLLGGTIISGIAIVSSGEWLVTLPAFKSLNAANPFLFTTDMLVDSVSEHATTTIDLSYFFLSILMIFGGIGAWLLFQKKVIRSFNIKTEMAAFALIIGFLGIYFSSAFVRLEVFGSISITILASIGIAILISKILKARHKNLNIITKISFLVGVGILLMIPAVYPDTANWSNKLHDKPISILHSGTHFNISTNDWIDAMQWLKQNTDEDAVIAAWWDYGYWISTLGERKTLADNATLVDWQIRKIAAMFFSTPDDAWKILISDVSTNVGSHYVSLPTDLTKPTRQGGEKYDLMQFKIDNFKIWKNNSTAQNNIDREKSSNYQTLFDYWEKEVHQIPPVISGLDADYVIINLAAEKLSDENVMELYTMRSKGGDETKAFWLLKIADLQVRDYLNPGLETYSDKFWNDTLFGKLIPFTPLVYVDPANPETQSEIFKQGYVAVYVKDVKFPPDSKGPFQLVYMPPSFEKNEPGPLTGPFIYKVNKEYNPNQ